MLIINSMKSMSMRLSIQIRGRQHCHVLSCPQIRTSIKSLFPDRDCAVLVRPAHEEAALVSLDIEDRCVAFGGASRSTEDTACLDNSMTASNV